MPSVLDPTVGGSAANTYASAAEAAAYFDDRIPITPPWVASGDATTRLLLTATRTLDALAQPFKTLVPAQKGEPAYYRIRRQWRGKPATTTQRLAFPRVGLFDMNGNALDVAINSNSAANPSVVSCGAPHNRQTGDQVLIFGVVGSIPDINGSRQITVIDAMSFSVPVNVTTPGAGGRFAAMPLEIKQAQAELAGQLAKGDRTLDNDVIVQGLTGIKAGSVALNFKDNIVPQVIPDAVYNLMPLDWLTPERYEPALRAHFGIMSRPSIRWPGDENCTDVDGDPR